MNLKKFISGVSALTIAASAFAGMAVTANAEATTVVNAALTAAPENADAYTWGADVASMVSANGMLLGNGSSANNNYTDRSIISFTSPVGNASNSVALSYTVKSQGSNYSKGQDYTNLILSYYDNEGSLLFSVSEGIGKWANKTTLTYTAADGVKTADLTTNISSTSPVNVSATITFNSTGGTLTIGGNAYAFVGASGIKDIKATVSGGSDFSRGVYVTNLALATEEVTEQKALVTVNSYDRADNSIIRTSTSEVVVGETYNATDDQKATFTASNGKKYIFNADDSTVSAEVTETGATISLYFDEAGKYTYTVNAVGDVSKNIASENIYDGDGKDIYFPRYIMEGSTIYETDAKNSGAYYGIYVSEAGTTDITYTKKFENVVIFDDLDDTTANNANVRASNGKARDNGAYESAELPAGKYVAVVRFLSQSRGSTLTAGDVTLVNYSDYGKGSWQNKTVEFELTEPAKIVLNAGGSNTRDDLDTVVVYKVGPTAEVTGISYKQYAKTSASDKDVTAAKVYVEITGTAQSLGLEYDGTTKPVANFEGLTDANILLGAIIPGLVELELSSFTAVAN